MLRRLIPDGMFNREPWAKGMDPWNRKLFMHVRTTPPGCLAGLSAEPAHDQHRAEFIGWSIACKCGGRSLELLGHPMSDIDPGTAYPQGFLSPLAVRCGGCGATTELFDSSQHGYDAEFGKRNGHFIDTNRRGSGERRAATCPACQGTLHRITATLGFSHFDHVDDEPELAPVAQDFFDSFCCLLRCDGCGNEWSIPGFELA